jgi:hypothetical protein
VWEDTRQDTFSDGGQDLSLSWFDLLGDNVSIDVVESDCQIGKDCLREPQIPLRSCHGGMSHVRCQVGQFDAEVFACSVPLLEAMNGEGVANLVKSRPLVSTGVRDAGAAEKLSENPIDGLRLVETTSR